MKTRDIFRMWMVSYLEKKIARLEAKMVELKVKLMKYTEGAL